MFLFIINLRIPNKITIYIQDVKHEDQYAHSAVQNAQQLTPIVVTEKKIISLKKKEPTVVADSSATTTTKVVRNIPTAKVFPESIRNAGTTAVVKPVPKASVRTVIASTTAKIAPPKHYHNHKNASEFDDEDELLADSPSSSPTYSHSTAIPSSSQKTSVTASANVQPSRFGNRRVVLKSSESISSSAINAKQSVIKQDRKHQPPTSNRPTSAATSKGVFDRLERKVTTSDAAKRKIQRIGIQKTE